MTRPKVLLVSHNHPDLLVGGVEVYVGDVYRGLRESGRFEPVLLARAGLPFSRTDSYHEIPLAAANRDPNQYLLYTEFGDFDPFFGRLATTKSVLSDHFAQFLEAQQPDLVHFQHTAYLGYETLRVTRNVLPDVPIVYSLHEYMPICNRDGVMVRATNEEICEEESPRRCHECFPAISPQQFSMRKRYIQSHFELVDRFIAPSDYVKARYVQWGLPESKIDVEPQGFPRPDVTADDLQPLGDDAAPGTRDRFAYFGTLNPYKGADVLLRALDVLGGDFTGHVWLYGANLEKQSLEWQKRFGELATERPNVTYVGGYQRSELARLMARIDWVVVPSNWWETGPLVVWEAFQHGRPVICSDIGGQSEKVADGVNGLHFRRGDPADLARVLKAAAETPALWDELRAGIPPRPGHALDEHVGNLTRLYEGLLTKRASGSVNTGARSASG